MSAQTENWLLRLILIAFLLLGVVFAIITPAFEASDELWHYPMIRHLADGNSLPVQVTDPALAGPWKQEASQPPLYYYLGAALTFWIDTSDMETVRWLNPHVDNGVITTDGNTNLAIHPDFFNPRVGTLLAVRIVRLFSVLLGAAAVYLTYQIAREVTPNRPDIALGAAALNALTPMFLFISGAVNNDNLAIPLASLGILLLIRLVTRTVAARSRKRELPRILIIGAVIGLAVLTKQGTIGLLPLAWGTFVIWEWRRWRLRQSGKEGNAAASLSPDLRTLAGLVAWSIVDFALMAMPVLLIAGWWYWRNIQLYGDLLGWSAFVAVLGQRETPASLAQLWDERWGFMLSYWGLFGGVNIPMWRWSYLVLNSLLIAALPGGLLFAGRVLRGATRVHFQPGGERGARGRANPPAALLLGVEANFPLVVVVLFAAAVIFGLIQWATTTWSSQGRLVFTAISALNILWALGLAGGLPVKFSRVVLAGAAGLLLFLAAASPFTFIRPAYQAQLSRGASIPFTCHLSVCLEPGEVVFGDRLHLIGFDFPAGPLRPGDLVDLTLEWGVTGERFTEDWSAFIHLNDPVIGVPIAQRDMYFGQGLLPTRLLAAGDQLTNRYRLQVPATAVAPADLSLTVGLYQFQTGERLRRLDGSDHLELGRLSLLPTAGETPNPIAVNFEDRFELIGFAVEPRRARPGETIDLTLYVRALAPPPADYTFFAQVVDRETTRWAYVDLGQPTTGWLPGEVQALQLPLSLSPDTPANIYPLRVGIYRFDQAAGFVNLQRITADGRLTDDFINLTLIRVDP